MAEFKVGGRVLCVKNHSEMTVKKGVIYPVTRVSKCGCGIVICVGILDFRADEGIREGYTHRECPKCGRIEPITHTEHYFLSTLFIPLDDDIELSDFTAEQLIEQLEHQLQEC